jgi:hypothetical protein
MVLSSITKGRGRCTLLTLSSDSELEPVSNLLTVTLELLKLSASALSVGRTVNLRRIDD